MARKRRKKRGSTTTKRAGEHVQAGGVRVYVEEVAGGSRAAEGWQDFEMVCAPERVTCQFCGAEFDAFDERESD